jgi:hypothetical protein
MKGHSRKQTFIQDFLMFYLLSKETQVKKKWGVRQGEKGIQRSINKAVTTMETGANSTGEILGARVDIPFKGYANKDLICHSCQSLFFSHIGNTCSIHLACQRVPLCKET